MEPERAADVRSMWGPENGERPTPNPVNDALFAGIGLEVAADFPVSPESVWDLVSDPTRIGEFSPECQAARWIEGSDRTATGARFEGTNRTTLDDGRIFEWIRMLLDQRLPGLLRGIQDTLQQMQAQLMRERV